MNLPQPKLGQVSAITIATPDLEGSLAFYQKLGFTESMRYDIPFPWIQITDGAILIMLRKDDLPYIALTYYVKDIDQLVTELEGDGLVFEVKPINTDFIKRCLIKTPDGGNLTLVSFVDGFIQPTGATLLTTPPQDFSDPDRYINKTCGIFGEFAMPVNDFDQSVAFWAKLGFKVLSQFTTPYKWGIITDGLNIIGLHETNSFTHPTITFFAADMKVKIEALKNSGIVGFTDKGPANAVLTTPEKQQINFFKLGM